MEIVLASIGRLVVLLALGIRAEAQLVNGNFETGDFTGWTLYNEEHGTLGVSNIVVFDTAGTGTPSQCAQFEAGKSEIYEGAVTGYGGGIKQNVMLSAGRMNFSASIAAYHSGSSPFNADGGNFMLILDGDVIVTNYFGKIFHLQTMRSTLSYSGPVAAGMHEIAIAIRRPYLSADTITPYQYIDNVTLTVSEIKPIPLNIQRNGSTVVLTWTNATFGLQAAPSTAGTYTNIPGATSPYTNIISSAATFFRLMAN